MYSMDALRRIRNLELFLFGGSVETHCMDANRKGLHSMYDARPEDLQPRKLSEPENPSYNPNSEPQKADL